MIITKEKFKVFFLKWVDKKLNSLPEEDFETSMFKQSVKIIGDHNGEYLNMGVKVCGHSVKSVKKK